MAVEVDYLWDRFGVVERERFIRSVEGEKDAGGLGVPWDRDARGRAYGHTHGVRPYGRGRACGFTRWR